MSEAQETLSNLGREERRFAPTEEFAAAGPGLALPVVARVPLSGMKAHHR
jgi:hypothetical protein